MNNMELNEQRNRLKVVGYVKKKDLTHRTFNNTDTIMGSVTITYKKGKQVHSHRINVFAPEYSRNGNKLRSYDNWNKFDQHQPTGEVKFDGVPTDRVSITGDLRYNIFKTKRGEVVKTLRLNGGFISRVDSNFNKGRDMCRAEIILTITGYRHEIQDGKPTNNVVVDNVNVGYNNNINTIPNMIIPTHEFGVDNVKKLMSYYPVGSTVRIQVEFENYAKVQNTAPQAAHGFGHYVEMGVATQFVHRNVIEFVDDRRIKDLKPNLALNSDQLQHAKNLLKQAVDEVQNSDQTSNQSNSAQPSSPFSAKKTANVNQKLGDASVPFF